MPCVSRSFETFSDPCIFFFSISFIFFPFPHTTLHVYISAHVYSCTHIFISDQQKHCGVLLITLITISYVCCN